MKLFTKGMMALLCVAGMAGVSQAAVVKLIADGVAVGAVGSEAYAKRLTTNLTMKASNEYHLDGFVIVNPGVTLTIEPGTLIRGYNEINTMAYRPGLLVIERGAKIYANGTAEKPIIFTDKWDNNVPGMTAGVVTNTWIYRKGGATSQTLTDHPYDYSKLGGRHGAWGSVVLCGNAFLNTTLQTNTLGNSTFAVEGLSALDLFGGGRDDEDSSGVFKYVQLRYGGYPLGNGSEINGLTMYGVGRGTELHHVEVYNNQDDGFEWFGGTVNGKYLVCHGAGDDTFDSDIGYRGKNQFLFGVQRHTGGTKVESGCSDKGMEMDGTEGTSKASAEASGMQDPHSASEWHNITLVGWNSGSGSGESADFRNGAIVNRDDACPQIWNSLFLNFGSFGTLIENKSGSGNNHSFYRYSTDSATTGWGTTITSNLVFWGNAVASQTTIDDSYLYRSRQSTMQAAIKGCSFFDCGGESGGGVCPAKATAPGWGTDAAPEYGDGSKGPIFTAGDNINLLADATLGNADLGYTTLPVLALNTGALDMDAEWSGSSFKTLVGPRVFTVGVVNTNMNPLVTGVSATNALPIVADGVIVKVPYRGAFGDKNWARGWTALDSVGFFGAALPAVGAINTVTAFDLSPAGSFATVEGRTYVVQSATNLVTGPFTTVLTLQGTGGSVQFADIGQNALNMNYRVLVQ